MNFVFKGFQLIVVPDKTAISPPQAPCCGGLLHKHTTTNGNGSSTAVLPITNTAVTNCATTTTVQKSTILNMSTIDETNREYLLSIGRIFHKITLNDSVITVTRYRPR